MAFCPSVFTLRSSSETPQSSRALRPRSCPTSCTRLARTLSPSPCCPHLSPSPCHPVTLTPTYYPTTSNSNSTLVLANRWGKRSRLREKLLWAVDDDGYYRRQGSGTHPAEATYEGYLQLTGELLDMEADGLRPLRRMEAEQPVKMEGV